MKKTSYRLIIAASLAAIVQTASAQVILTDNFTVDSNQNDPNYEIGNGRQGGTAAPSSYTEYTAAGDPWNVQVGSGTVVGQPGGTTNTDYLLLALDGAVQNNLNVSTATPGPLSISFDLYNRVWGHPGDWGAFTLQAAGADPFPVVNANEFGFLSRNTGGMQLFDGTGNITPAGWDTNNFATNTQWTFIFTDTSGTGSAFNGNGSQVTIMNGGYTLGAVTLNQLNTTDIEFGFRAENNNDGANLPLIGIANLSVAPSVPPAWLPLLAQDTAPASASVAAGSNVVFTAAFSNSPPVTLQWLQITSGTPNVTNNINTGVVTVTNQGVVTSTLTLNSVPLTGSGSYQLEAINATNAAGVAYSTPAPITVFSTITWYAPGTYNSSFSDDTVLALAGSVANEVYGVDFGGSDLQTTGNGYTFDDPADTGNFTMAGTPGGYGGFFMTGATTGDPAFDAILNNGVYGTTANTGTLNNLTVGQTYTVMVLLADTEGSSALGQQFVVTDGFTVSPQQQYAYTNGVPEVGGYIIGTFTAQATTQPLTVETINGSTTNSQYSAILLEKGIAPPPFIAPTLTTDINPLLSEVAVGGPVTLSVAAAGSAPLHYQWSNQGGLIRGATNASYLFNALAGTNFYTVSVSNTVGGAVSSIAEVISATNIVTVNNFSFENGTGSGYTPSSWTAFNYSWSGVFDETGNNYPVYDPLAAPAQGNNFFACNTGPGQPTSGICQDVGALLPSTTYTLTVAIGYSQAAPVSGQSTWSPGIISLINGANNAGLVLETTNGIPATPGTWQDFSVTFITGPSVSGDLTVELAVAGAPTYQAQFDNVRLTKAPAPAVVPPTLLTDIQPLRSEVTTGVPLTFSVTANGNPLSYQWFNQNGPIGGATNSSYSFSAVAGTNSYYVAVTNTANSIVSSTAVVISAPDIVTVNNFSFENGTTAGPGGGTLPVSWTQAGSVNWCAVATGGGYSIVPDGTNFFALNEGPSDPTGGIYQNVGALLPNTTYTLTVALGYNPGFLNSPGIISLINGADYTGTVLATGGGLPATQGAWQDYSVTYTTGASVSGDLVVELSVAGASTYQANFDDVRLTTAAAVIASAPTLNALTVSGGNLILTGSGGAAGSAYTLLTTTNLAAPILWTTNSAGTLDGSGAFSNSVPIGAAPARFYRVLVP